MNNQHCVRCGQAAPDQESDEFLEWEAMADGRRVICPGCLTGTELRAMAEDVSLTILDPDHAICPRGTAWCVDHQDDADQCVGEAIRVSESCAVWLLQEIEGLEPTIVVDVGRGSLSMDESTVLQRALEDLRRAAGGGQR